MTTLHSWFEEHVRTLEAFGFKLDPRQTGGSHTTYVAHNPAYYGELLRHFKSLGFVNLDNRVYRFGGGMQHVNLNMPDHKLYQSGNTTGTIQIGRGPTRGSVNYPAGTSVTFMNPIQEDANVSK